MIPKPENMTNQEYHRNYLYLYILNECTNMDEVFEIGCGDGTGGGGILGPPMIADKVYNYTGIDKKRYVNPPSNMNLIQADIQEDGLGGLYDKIICLQVAQYVDKDKVFNLASEHLAMNGKAYFSEGLAWSEGEEKRSALEIRHMMFLKLLDYFERVEIFGIADGIIVPETMAKTGVFAVASNQESTD